MKGGSPRKLYEAKAKSTGICSVIIEVFDEMLEVMFEGFPGESGKSRRITFVGEANC